MTGTQIAPALGWSSSVLLLITISYQVWRQWKTEHSEGVTPWLFVGQAVASTGFTIYSVLLDNWIFTFTNSALAVSGVVGLWVCLMNTRRTRRNDRAQRRHATVSE